METETRSLADRLRHETGCVSWFCPTCSGIIEEAASEIERLQTQSCDRSSDEMMKSLSEAILNTDPCGRDDCIAVGSAFLAKVRNEMARLREIVALGSCMVVAAKAAWLSEPDARPEGSKLMSIVRTFEEFKA